MLQSKELNEILPALFLAKAKIKAIVKGGDNPFFKSQYADLPSILDAIEPALSANDIMILQPPEVFADGRRVVETFLMHKSGQFIGCQMELLMVKPDAQSQGSAITYTRRQELQSLLGLKVIDDDDGNAASGNDSKASKPSKPPESPKLANKIPLTTLPSTDKQSETPVKAPAAPAGRVGFGRA